MLSSRDLFVGTLVRVTEVTCDAPRGGCGHAEWNDAPQVIVPQRGAFTLHRGRSELTADPLTAIVIEGEYCVSHPADGGDRCTAITLSPPLHDEVFRDARVLPTRERLAVTDLDDLVAREEHVLGFLARLAALPPVRPGRVAQEVREILAAHPTRRWTLAALARAVHTSPFHMARQFRVSTGHSIGDYLLGLRLAIALDRLRQGENDIAGLAVSLGFASHSHFTERFRRAHGATPSQLRTILTAP